MTDIKILNTETRLYPVGGLPEDQLESIRNMWLSTFDNPGLIYELLLIQIRITGIN